ncbi:hypothetical protein [Richelia sinica]|uniref:hypothetical protein n=1 Tax=Richelia sinica TaxID=1357545 RepID=UPI00168740BF|nr:hypothetical protein [Richelia sinica]MBD2666684.1 hypothetical protein [Richelia sinica FACHB-800]
MDKLTADRRTRLAPKNQQFLMLHPDDHPLLGRAEKRAISVIEAIHTVHYMSYEKIAAQTDTNVSTVK